MISVLPLIMVLRNPPDVSCDGFRSARDPCARRLSRRRRYRWLLCSSVFIASPLLNTMFDLHFCFKPVRVPSTCPPPFPLPPSQVQVSCTKRCVLHLEDASHMKSAFLILSLLSALHFCNLTWSFFFRFPSLCLLCVLLLIPTLLFSR